MSAPITGYVPQNVDKIISLLTLNIVIPREWGLVYSWSITLRAFVVISRIGWDNEQTISKKAVKYSEIKTEKCSS